MWKSTCRRMGTPALVAAVIVASLGAPTWATAQDAGQSAVWTPKELQFVYFGFTTKYTCDGLRDKVKTILLQLGARKDDLKVMESPCAGDPNRPSPFPGVTIKMSVLTPSDQAPTPDGQTVTAHWTQVDLLKGQYGVDAAGECELIEQVNQKILPLFNARNIDLKSGCVPHQLSPLGTRLKAEVLITDQKKPVAPKS